MHARIHPSSIPWLVLLLTCMLGVRSSGAQAAPVAGGKPTFGAPPIAVARTPRLSPETQALTDIQQNGERTVAELVRNLAGLPQGPAHEAGQRLIVAAKLETRIRILRARSQFAQGRGDLAGARECDHEIAQLTAPAHVADPLAPNDRVKPQGGGVR